MVWNRSSVRVVLCCVPFLLVGASAHPCTGAVAIGDFAPAEYAPNDMGTLYMFSFDATIGWSFTPRQDIYVTDLGFFDEGIGLGELHAVGIWDAERRPLTSAVLGGNGPKGGIFLNGEVPHWPRIHDGDFCYASIDPLWLRGGETYVIGATVPFSGLAPAVVGGISRIDGYPLAVTPGSLVIDPRISIVESALAWPGTADRIFTPGPGELHFPDRVYADGAFVGVNFQFSVVPEPSTLPLACIGLLGLLIRCWQGKRRIILRRA